MKRMIITGGTMLSTVEIQVYRVENLWKISMIAYGEWIIEKFQNPQECIRYIEQYIRLSEEEKTEIRNMEG
ncbi:MAG: hypothetical protein ACRCU6_05665 [Fusobacteriaceae bacterium]